MEINKPLNKSKQRSRKIGSDFVSRYEPINEPIKIVLDIITVFPYLSKKQITDRTGMSRTSVTRALMKLVQMGKIRRVGSNKNGHWEIVEK